MFIAGDTWSGFTKMTVLFLEDRSLTFNVSHNLLVQHTSLAAHLLGKGLGGPPLGRVARSRLFHHLVNLLESQTLGLWDEEDGVDEGASAETTPNEEDRRLQVATVGVNHVRSDNSNNLKARR